MFSQAVTGADTVLALSEEQTQQLLAQDPIWLVILKVVVLFAFAMLMTLIMVNVERKVVGRMQHRPGPNRVGPNGWLQSLADGLKLAFKEDIRPVLADKWVYFIAPVVSTIPAFLAFSVIPFGPQVNMFGHQTALQLTDLPVGLLVILACSSLGVYGIVLSGWSSGSPYPLLGAVRSAAQVISYEIAMGLAIVAVIIQAHSLSTADIVQAQQGGWYFWLLLPSFVIYVISMIGETNRAPFDLPEAESELVGGFHTEYTSLKFALFFLAEYVNMVVVERREHRLPAGGVVPDQDADLSVRLHLAARHAAPPALRPVHAAGLEVPGADQSGVDRRGDRGARCQGPLRLQRHDGADHPRRRDPDRAGDRAADAGTEGPRRPGAGHRRR